MRFLDLVQLIFDNLKRRKGRVAMTAVGVLIGTASIVLLVSLANGLQQSATSSLGNVNDLTKIEVYPKYDESSMGGGMMVMSVSGGGGGSQAKALLTDQLLNDIAAIDGVTQVIPRTYVMGQASMKYGKLENYSNIIGYGVDDVAVFQPPVAQGTTAIGKGSAVIGSWAATSFYDPNWRPGMPEQAEQPDLLGKRIRLTLTKYTSDGLPITKDVDITIVGILAETRSELDYSLIVNLDDVTRWNEWFNGQRINYNRTGYESVIVKVTDVDHVTDIAETIGEMGFQTYTAQSFVEQIQGVFLIIQLIFGGIGAISLLVAAIGIANTMTMAILERTREIGLMKAIGASNRDVLIIFLGEAAGIGFIGGVLGTLLGWLVGKGLDVIMVSVLTARAVESGATVPASMVYTPPYLVVFAILFSVLVGLFSGVMPALRAASLQPVMALKYE
jgi:putative ABC transport system permease protein